MKFKSHDPFSKIAYKIKKWSKGLTQPVTHLEIKQRIDGETRIEGSCDLINDIPTKKSIVQNCDIKIINDKLSPVQYSVDPNIKITKTNAPSSLNP